MRKKKLSDKELRRRTIQSMASRRRGTLKIGKPVDNGSILEPYLTTLAPAATGSTLAPPARITDAIKLKPHSEGASTMALRGSNCTTLEP